MSVSITTMAIDTTTVITQPTVAARASGQTSDVSVISGDAVVLSDRARELLGALDPSVQPPDAQSTDADRSRYAQDASRVSNQLQWLDGIKLSPDFQSFADVINDPKASDDQKFDAYSKYRAESAVNDTKYGSWSLSDQDWKFNYVTKNSDFMKRLGADPSTGFITGANGPLTSERAKAQTDPRYVMNQDQNNMEIISSGVNQSLFNQKATALNVVAWRLVEAIQNGDDQRAIDDPSLGNVNDEPGFTYQGPSLAIDTKTAIARAVAKSLTLLNQSSVSSTSDQAASTYSGVFTDTVSKFGQYASDYVARLT